MADIALAIVAGGVIAHYAGPKAVGCLIWDLRTGMFGQQKPDPHMLLNQLGESEWTDCIVKLNHAAMNPLYGSITIDFDARRLTDANRYGSSNVIFGDWLKRSLLSALEGQDGIVPGSSLLAHLLAGRIELVDGDANDSSVAGHTLAGKTVRAALDEIASLPIELRVGSARLRLPDGWTHQRHHGFS